jgi:hypothetical protein
MRQNNLYSGQPLKIKHYQPTTWVTNKSGSATAHHRKIMQKQQNTDVCVHVCVFVRERERMRKKKKPL